MDSIKHRIVIWQMATGKGKDELCDELRMSKSTLYSKLNGVTEFSLTEARTLAQLFGCSVDELFIDPIEEYVAVVG